MSKRFGNSQRATKAALNVARFSDCRDYRYTLVRTYDNGGKATINFVMMNPSVADEKNNDPTVARCEDFALRWGYGRMIITNIFAYRATAPEWLLKTEDPVGRENDSYILQTAKAADRVVCAWGKPPKHLKARGEAVKKLLCDSGVPLYYLALNADGSPRHPLYLRGDSLPIAWIEADTDS